MTIPIIDLFAGPGGLGEGFSTANSATGQPLFKIKLSIEKDKFAHQTLELRAFYRQFIGKAIPSHYYEYLRRKLNRSELFDLYPKESATAKHEAWLAELGKTDRGLVRSRIEEALNGASNWLLIGGPPCQAYSLAGRSRMLGGYKGEFETDPRHFLYKEYLHILAEHQPPVFVMENVKGLLSAKLQQQNTFELILSDLQNPVKAVGDKHENSLSYRLFSVSKESSNYNNGFEPEDFIVRSEDYGIPQARHRIIILGIRSDIFNSSPETLRKEARHVSIEEVIGDLPRLRSGLSKEDDSAELWRNAIKEIEEAKWLKLISFELRSSILSALRRVGANLDRGEPFIPFIPGPKEHYAWYVDEKLTGACNHETRAHIRKDLHRYFFASVFAREYYRPPTLADFPIELLPKHENIHGVSDNSIFNDRFRVQVRGKPSTTVVSHISKDGHYYIHYDPSQCRSLTVREAARLQTFPDNYLFEGNRTQQYHQVGNAVPPLLANKIAEKVFNVLRNSKK
jgi:DNA (cytosine-5)-methyltransferase 1